MTHGVEVVRRRCRELHRLIGVETLFAHRLGGHLTQRREVAKRSLEPALDVRAAVEVVVGDQRAEVVGAQRDQDRIDELAGTPRTVERLARLVRRSLARPQVGDACRMGRKKIAEVPGHAAEV